MSDETSRLVETRGATTLALRLDAGYLGRPDAPEKYFTSPPGLGDLSTGMRAGGAQGCEKLSEFGGFDLQLGSVSIVPHGTNLNIAHWSLRILNLLVRFPREQSWVNGRLAD